MVSAILDSSKPGLHCPVATEKNLAPKDPRHQQHKMAMAISQMCWLHFSTLGGMATHCLSLLHSLWHHQDFNNVYFYHLAHVILLQP